MRRSRTAHLRTLFRERGLDALLVTSLPHVRYLSGFSGSNGICVITSSDAFFVTDIRYALQCREDVRGFRRLVTMVGLFEASSRHKLLAGCTTVGFESHHLSYAQYRSIRKLFPAISWKPVSDLIEQQTLVKDGEELACIQKAVDISDRVFGGILPIIRPGIREIEIAAEISYLHKSYGAERDAFDPIVASGERGALPHARAGVKKIRNGELVTLDFGCTVKGYASDLTRTIAVGRVSRKSREVYEVVLNAQEEAIRAARPGILARELDAVARKAISAAGYGKYFSHSLGHGLGIHIHEHPRISALSNELLQSGSVVTIEPGVYIPGFGGIRIEDDVVLLKKGCRVLTAAPKELMIV